MESSPPRDMSEGVPMSIMPSTYSNVNKNEETGTGSGSARNSPPPGVAPGGLSMSDEPSTNHNIADGTQYIELQDQSSF